MTVEKYYTYEDFKYEDLLTYAGLDCIVTTGILKRIFPLLTEEKKIFVFDGLKKEIATLPSILEVTEKYEYLFHEFIIDMELNGIKYDIDLNRNVCKQMEEEIEELKAEIFSCIGKQINLDSDKEVKELLYDTLGLTPERFTKNRQPSVDAEAMEDLSNRYPEHKWLRDLGKYGDIVSLYRTFVVNYVKDHVKSDGRVHPQYNLHGTSSFRITGDNPNLTQLPRPKHGYNLRKFFTVDDGCVFVAADFSSAEVKILGAISKDPALLKAIEDGLDFHSFSASKMHGIPYEEFVAAVNDKSHEKHKDYKLKRQEAKALTFGLLYGSTANGIALNLGITVHEAQALIDLYFNAYPLIRKYIEDTHNMAIANHMVVTPFGRRKMEFGTLPPFKYTAAWNAALRNGQNVRIQSPTSDIGLYCFAKLNEQIKKLGGKTLCTVYDSVELQIPIEHLETAIELVYKCMDDLPVEIFPWLTLPIGVEVEIGKNWGELEVIHRGATQQQLESLLQ